MACSPYNETTRTSRLAVAVAIWTTVAGVVTEDGVTCRTVRGDDGELYSFTSLPAGLSAGDRVTVELVRQDGGSCDQGLQARWRSIVRPASGDAPQARWTSPD